MLGAALILAAAATAFLIAAGLRLSSLVSTALAAYLAYVANLGAVTLALSPVHEVTRLGLAIAEGVLLAGAVGFWWSRGRPGAPLASARVAARAIAFDPVTAAFVVVVLAVLAYEVLLASSPPNNQDSLTYHLARAALWAQHGGLYWIPHAPEVELNEYQPLAEQQQLFLIVAMRGNALYALPQYLAELASLVAVYGASRRLGFAVRPAACAALLLATFSSVALEAITAQNDLIAASFVAASACLLLGEGLIDPALGGVAAAFSIGTKLTAGLVLPILVALAVVRGRRTSAAALTGALLGFVGVAMWGYVLNDIHTGDFLGAGTAFSQDRGSPSYPGSVANWFYIAYGAMDLSVLSNRLIHVLAIVGIVAGVIVGLVGVDRRRVKDSAAVALPFLAPLLVLGGAGLLAFVARRWGFPIRGSDGLLAPVDANLNEVYGRISNEDYSAYGPLGIVAVLAAIVLTARAWVARRVDARHIVLAAAFPLFLVLLALESTWVPFLTRFLLLPAVLAAPLLARLFTSRVTTAAYVAVAAITIGLTITHDQPKPLSGPFGRPWDFTQATALAANSDAYLGRTLTDYERLVPPHACVGVVVGVNEPTDLLVGPHLQHRLTFFAPDDALLPALRAGLFYVVISATQEESASEPFRAAGWRIRPLDDYWLLASDTHAGDGGTCR